MTKRGCLNKATCPGYLDECSLEFPIEVRGGLQSGDKIFVCNVCMRVFFVTQRPLCDVCGMTLFNSAHFYYKEQIIADREKLWPKHKFRSKAKS